MGVYTERLKLVRSAIDEILTGGQNVSYQGRTLTMADLKTLRDLEKEYEQLAAGEAGKAVRGRIINVTPVS